MSESLKIGGIGKNPAIDKICALNSVDVKSYVSDKMESLLLSNDDNDNTIRKRIVPLDFSSIAKNI